MAPIYHKNARTNKNIRLKIQQNKEMDTIRQLSKKYHVSTQTIQKWKHRNFVNDAPSIPHNIDYSLTELEKGIVCSVRKTSWFSINKVVDIMRQKNQNISRSSVYRCLVSKKLNKVPYLQKKKAQKLKEYEPGLFYVDITYLPKLEGVKQYLFIAIDRANGIMFYDIYDKKTTENTEHFINSLLEKAHFMTGYILTDNGLELTNKLLVSKMENPVLPHHHNVISSVKKKV
ncbi:MAG: hypothetical protein QM536_09020 [Chitinophagaceae bacterium]|nr:hypothetical protein [Chitinophagaceae bacterium]